MAAYKHIWYIEMHRDVLLQSTKLHRDNTLNLNNSDVNECLGVLIHLLLDCLFR